MIYQDKVYVVDAYDDWVVSSPSEKITVPSVVALYDYVPHKRQIPFTRNNIYARDGFKCQYCGRSAEEEENLNKCDLTFDHVVPKSRDGKTTWTNIVTCCKECNLTKGDDLLEDIDLELDKEPRKPRNANPLLLELKGKNVPEEWDQWFAGTLDV
jgi:5-methylcytosine-specific restriction endonuclease McrA